jgi:hypothetical protein
MRAEAFPRNQGHIGAVALSSLEISRGEAVVSKKFGEVPDDLSAL